MTISSKITTTSFPDFHFFNKEERASKVVSGNLVDRIVAFALTTDPLKNLSAIKLVTREFHSRYSDFEFVVYLICLDRKALDQFPQQQLFKRAIEINSLISVQKLLSLTVVTENKDNPLLLSDVDLCNRALQIACAKGYKEIIQYLIDERNIACSVIFYEDEPITHWYSPKGLLPNLESPFLSAVRGNQLEVVQLFLNHSKIKRNDLEAAFCEACRLGRTRVVELFLIHSSEQWGEWNQYSLDLAFENDHLETVKVLLKNKKFSLRKNYISLLRLACCKGDIKFVKEVLKNKTEDLNPILANHPLPLYSAIEGRYVDIVRILLADKCINPADHDLHALKLAGQTGQTQIVKELLKDKRVSIFPILTKMGKDGLAWAITSIALHAIMNVSLLLVAFLEPMQNNSLITSHNFLVLNGLVLGLTTTALVGFIFYRIFSHLWLITSIEINLVYYHFKQMIFPPENKKQIEQKKF